MIPFCLVQFFDRLVGWLGFLLLLFRDVAAQKVLDWQGWDTVSQGLQGVQFPRKKTPMSQADNEGRRRGGALKKKSLALEN